MDFQWYPGHMTRAKREMEEDLKLIDLVIELLDARAPKSSRNPDIDKLANGKSRLILLNKADLADPLATEAWVEYLSSCGATGPSGDGMLSGCGEAQETGNDAENSAAPAINDNGCPLANEKRVSNAAVSASMVNIPVVALDSRSRASMKTIDAAVRKACAKKIERNLRRGIKNRPVRAMVVGIPNVGKSTFINSYAKRAAAKTGNKPGVTKGRQWIRLSKALELLDTPGILWPKFEDQKAGLNLALLGSIRDEIIDSEELALELIKVLAELYPGVVKGFYGIPVGGKIRDEEEFSNDKGYLEEVKKFEFLPSSADNDAGENIADKVNLDDKNCESEGLNLRNSKDGKMSNMDCLSEHGLAKSEELGTEPVEFKIIQEIARARGCLIKGGELDTARAARLLLDDFRGGRLGRISLERP